MALLWSRFRPPALLASYSDHARQRWPLEDRLDLSHAARRFHGTRWRSAGRRNSGSSGRRWRRRSPRRVRLRIPAQREHAAGDQRPDVHDDAVFACGRCGPGDGHRDLVVPTAIGQPFHARAGILERRSKAFRSAGSRAPSHGATRQDTRRRRSSRRTRLPPNSANGPAATRSTSGKARAASPGSPISSPRRSSTPAARSSTSCRRARPTTT